MSHCTHCGQPFDVAIASSLKTHFKKLIGSSYNTIKDDINFSVWKGANGETDQLIKKLTLDKLRHSMVLSFLDAMRWQQQEQIVFLHLEKAGFSS